MAGRGSMGNGDSGVIYSRHTVDFLPGGWRGSSRRTGIQNTQREHTEKFCFHFFCDSLLFEPPDTFYPT